MNTIPATRSINSPPVPRNTAGPSAQHRRAGAWVNDVHSQLNPTHVRAVLTPRTQSELAAIICDTAREGVAVSLCGSRHSMGGQPFGTQSVCIDTRELKRILSFDLSRGLIEVEAGIQWPDLISSYLARQQDGAVQWGIAQKQTGADNFTLGGSLGANVHGRGLTLKPLISNIECFTMLNAEGELLRCSREENPELFSLVIGGYGLFGVITTVTLRLAPRRKLQRVVEILMADDLIAAFNERIRDGCLYGDFQFSVDERSPEFLRRGVFSCYRPVADDALIFAPHELSTEQWLRFLYLAHTNRSEAFQEYARYYLSTNGQTYWSDTHQLGPYLPDYADQVREMSRTAVHSSLVLTELYVPRGKLVEFLCKASRFLRTNHIPVIYGTVRLIEKDEESFLAWAKEPYACVIFNLLTTHSEQGIARSAHAFRTLIDLAVSLGGNYYLTYHRFATREQLETCYPQFRRFLKLKLKYDPQERFQSDWYRHYRRLLESDL